MLPASDDSPSKQLAGFIAKFDPAMARQIREIRAALRRRFPAANELVFENYNYLVIGYCATERQSDCLVSISALAKGVTLHFYYGSALPDPHGLLQGSGNQNRFLRLDGAATLAKPEVEELLQAAIDRAKTPPRPGGRGRTIVRRISEKQRSRRLK